MAAAANTGFHTIATCAAVSPCRRALILGRSDG